VSTEGKALSRQLGIYNDDLVAALTDMTAAVHKAGGKIVIQLAHAGCVANSESSRQEALGPSALNTGNGQLGREMTREEIRRVVEAFGKGAARAEKAGFDGMQIHAAHGYLLSQFLSPFFNKRNDEYGGSLENRLKIVLEVFQSIKNHVGADFPVMIKMNSQDFLEGGLSTEEALNVAAVLAVSGIDAIELSGGTPYSGELSPVRVGKPDSRDGEVFYLLEAAKYKKRVTVP
jgi:2,4-dienoyl-CoA reductase-like NADH-dependent reductase (Old Yellow Enzyme family)